VCVLLFALSFPSPSRAQEAPALVIGKIDGLVAREDADEFSAATTPMALLRPFLVVDDSDPRYYLVEDLHIGVQGWVNRELVYRWPSRHALRPRRNARGLRGFCSRAEAQRDVDEEEFKACITFPRAIFKLVTPGSSDLSPFPVTGIEDLEGFAETADYLEVAVPFSFAGVGTTLPGSGSRSPHALAEAVELVIVLDVTSSMSAEFDAVKRLLSRLVGELGNGPGEVRVRLIRYHDGELLDSNLTTPEAVLQELGDATTSGGDEFLFDALWAAAGTDWSADAVKTLLVIADEPSNCDGNGGCSAWSTATTVGRSPSSGAPDTPAGETLESIVARFREHAHVSTYFNAIVTPDQEDSTHALVSQLTAVAQGIPFMNAGGDFLTRISSEEEDAQLAATATDLERIFKDRRKSLVGLREAVSDCVQELNKASSGRVLYGCWASKDPLVQAKFRELLILESEVVVNKIWIRARTQAFSDVVLLFRSELTGLITAIDKAQGALRSPNQSEALWRKVWESLIGKGAPGARRERFANSALWRYLGARSPDSILRKTLGEIKALAKNPAERKRISDRLTAARKKLSALKKNASQTQQVFWVSFGAIP